MKNIIVFAVLAVFMTSCVTTNVTDIPNTTTIFNVERDRVQILGEVEGKAKGARVWLLFIPIGWAKDSWVKGKAYQRALKIYPNADGIIDKVQTYQKITVPLIAITPQVKAVTLKGTAYHLRTDAELEEYLKRTKGQE